MKKILQDISKKALLLNEMDFTEVQKTSKWLGKRPNTEGGMIAVEKRLNLKLPEDYRDFMQIVDGFAQYQSTGVAFLSISEVDYLRKMDGEMIEAWQGDAPEDETILALKNAILIGRSDDKVQSFFLVPPFGKHQNWRYWLFAHWIPGANEFQNLETYFNEELAFLKTETKGLRKPKPKDTTDLSLQNAVFEHDWNTVFERGIHFAKNKIYQYYYNGDGDILKLLLLAAHQTNRFEDLKMFLETPECLAFSNEFLVNHYKEAVKNKLQFIDSIQFIVFTPQNPPRPLADIDASIAKNMKWVLKSDNPRVKLNYQLLFLFDGGNAEDFLKLYNTRTEEIDSDNYLKAAVIWAQQNKNAEAKHAIEGFYKLGLPMRPLEPFLNKTLFPLMTAEFSKHVFESATNR